MPDPDRGRDRRRRARRGPRSADPGVRPRAARGPAGRPRRSRSSCTPAARTSPCCGANGPPSCTASSTPRSPPASPACARSSATRPLLHEMVGVRLRKSASFTRWDTRPLSDEQVGYAREDVLHLLQLADALQDTPARPRPAGLGAGGVPLPGGCLRRARARHDLPPPAARELARALPARGGLRARALARGDRARDRPPRPQRARRRGARRGGQAPARLARAPGPDPRAQREHAAPPRRARSSRPSSAGASATAIPVDGDRPTPTDAKDAPLIALGEALVRARASEAELAYELLAARADLQRIVTSIRTSGDEPDGAHAAGLAARRRRRRAARAAAGPPLAARRARTDDRGHPLAQRYPSRHAPASGSCSSAH